MAQDSITTNEHPHFGPKLYSIAAIVAVIVLVGMWLVTRYIAIDVARDMKNWQEKLNLIAESRAVALTDYISGQYKELHTLADNPSLQLYLTELQMIPDDKAAKEPPAQFEYLRNLLIFTAQRGGYMQSGNAQIPANIESTNQNGLAVLNNDNTMVVSTPMPQAVNELVMKHAQDATGIEDTLIDLGKDKSGTAYMGYIVPIFSIQGEKDAESKVGKIVAIRAVDKSFYNLLKHPGVTEKTLEVTLVRKQGDSLRFLTPLQDNSDAQSKEIKDDPRVFAEAQLVATVGDFVTRKDDYRKRKVIATSREIPGTSWVMIVKVESAEALKASTQNRNNMIAVFVLMLAIIVLLIIAIWWHASSRRSLMLSYHFRAMAEQSRAQERLLRLVADHQPEAIYILDRDERYRFANKKAVEEAGMSPDAVVGKHVRDVRGSARALRVIEQAEKAMTRGQTHFHISAHEDDEGTHTTHEAYVPVAHIPVSTLPNPTPGVLVVEQDITEVVEEREKRVQIHQDLVNTLVTLVDRRDPFAANHSLMVSGLAMHVAQVLELDPVTIDTTRTAAMLMNIGKIVISTKILTKTAPLTDEERHVIRDSMVDAAELVRPIHFDGPVYDTLRQWQEKWDGSGTLGLEAEHILMPARILSVANTFVGMISPRSWRNAMTTEEAITFLMNNCGTLFDRRVVVALVHFIESAHGKGWLEHAIAAREAA